MNTTFQNAAQVLSIGVFFSLMISGLSKALTSTVATGLRAQGVSPATADHVAHLPPVSVLFAAFLGYNPIERLLGSKTISQLPAPAQATITARHFFPSLISAPFSSGLHQTFAFAAAICVVAAIASWSRGAKPVDDDELLAPVDAAPARAGAR